MLSLYDLILIINSILVYKKKDNKQYNKNKTALEIIGEQLNFIKKKPPASKQVA